MGDALFQHPLKLMGLFSLTYMKIYKISSCRAIAFKGRVRRHEDPVPGIRQENQGQNYLWGTSELEKRRKPFV